ncbi:MAG: hypothetical protein QOJ83_119 [Frankiales bacterium]|nr:hypothetical protein [Frankiales bacterium]
MGDRRRLAAVLTAAALSCVVATGCAGVPQVGAIHKVAPAPNAQVGPDNQAQQAQGPVDGASPAAIIQGLLVAMSDGDDDAAAQFFTKDYSLHWRANEGQRRVVFSDALAPSQVPKQKDKWQVQLNESGVIDSTGNYSRANAVFPVTFTFTLVNGREYRISNVSQLGTFVRAADLSQVAAPVRLYFPSAATPPGAIPRLVPDTVFLKPDSQVSQVVEALLGGPTSWLAPAVRTTVPQTTSVLGVLPDTRTGLTTINLSSLPDRSQAATLEAQLAYTLAPAQFGVSTLQLQVMGVPLGNSFSLSDINPGYDPDVLPSDAPLYYISPQDTLVSLPSSPQQTTANGLSAGAAKPTPTTVLDHVGKVQRIAVATTPKADGTIPLAGVRTAPAGATLVLSSTKNPAADPWTSAALPAAKAMSTPSFQAGSSAVWTVVRNADDSTQVYRVPLADGSPGTPIPVDAQSDEDKSPMTKISALRLSRDGSRVALVAGGRAYVGVVVPPRADGGTWSISGLRPVITVDADASAVDVYWEDQTTVGVLTQAGDPPKITTSLSTASSDGYTVSPNGTVDHLTVGGSYSGALQFAGGPGQPWVASRDGTLTRQPSPDTSGEAVLPGDQPWEPIDHGTWPTYPG